MLVGEEGAEGYFGRSWEVERYRCRLKVKEQSKGSRTCGVLWGIRSKDIYRVIGCMYVSILRDES